MCTGMRFFSSLCVMACFSFAIIVSGVNLGTSILFEEMFLMTVQLRNVYNNIYTCGFFFKKKDLTGTIGGPFIITMNKPAMSNPLPKPLFFGTLFERIKYTK